MTVAQVDAQGRLRHFLTLEGLPRTVLVRLLDLAQNFEFTQSYDANGTLQASIGYSDDRQRSTYNPNPGIPGVYGEYDTYTRSNVLRVCDEISESNR